jgi:hypothetical protein
VDKAKREVFHVASKCELNDCLSADEFAFVLNHCLSVDEFAGELNDCLSIDECAGEFNDCLSVGRATSPRGIIFIWRELKIIIPRGIYFAGALPRGNNLSLHPPPPLSVRYPPHSSMMFDPSFRRLVENGAKCAVNSFITSIKGVLLLVSSTHDLASTMRALLKRGHDWSDKNVLFHWVWWGKCHT